jgi:hypothetical protein
MREKPGGTSAPSSSTVEAGIVGISVGAGVSVDGAVGCVLGVAEEDVVGIGGVTVLVLGWHAVSAITVNRISLFKSLSISITSYPIYI